MAVSDRSKKFTLVVHHHKLNVVTDHHLEKDGENWLQRKTVFPFATHPPLGSAVDRLNGIARRPTFVRASHD